MSESGNYTKYVEAMAQYNKSSETLRGMISVVKQVGSLLSSQPIMFSFSNLPQGVGRLALSRAATTVDAKGWPSAENLQSALDAVLDAHNVLRNAWQSLSPEERDSMKPPSAAMIRG